VALSLSCPYEVRRVNLNAYESTARISLVSSFLASLFLGRIAPIEVADASGMNLMNVLTCEWDDHLLHACGGPELREKLGPEPVVGGTILGNISEWWVRRWGFSLGSAFLFLPCSFARLNDGSGCMVAPFTGDNPATVVPFSYLGDAILSLGTSTTLLLSIPPSDTAPRRFTTSHLLSHPTTSNAHIAMLCYKNGALARERIRDRYADGTWSRFNQLVKSPPLGSDGYLGLYYPLREIIPPNVQGEFYFSIKDGGTSAAPVDAIPDTAHPRAILESQFLSIRCRIQDILPLDALPLRRLVITGGASSNSTIRQLAADVFGMSVFVVGNAEAAATGGAILARFAWWRARRVEGTFDEMSRAMQAEGMDLGTTKMVAEPQSGGEITLLYERLVEVYRFCEAAVVQLMHT
jgi:xylulokinase